MPYSSVNSPQRWRERAEESRAIAEMMSSPDAKAAMLEVAAAYDRLAEKIETIKEMPSVVPFPASSSRAS